MKTASTAGFQLPNYKLPNYQMPLGFLELLFLDALVDDDGQVAADSVHRSNQALRRGTDQEQQLRVNLFLRRHVRERLDVFDRDDAAFDHTGLEGEFRVVFRVLGERLRERNWIAFGVGDRSDAVQALQRLLYLRALRGARGQRVLYNFVLCARSA